jgi:hypothetical protein
MAKKTSSKGKGRSKAKSIKKKTSKRTRSTEVVYHSTKEIKVEKALIENFIGLQKVMVNLSSKFDNLSTQLSKLLDLFEISAKSLARKEFSSSGELESKQVMEKLDSLSQQAGLIGKGLALIHEVGTQNERAIIPMNQQRNQPQMPSYPQTGQRFQPSRPAPQTTRATDGFQKSLDTSEGQ